MGDKQSKSFSPQPQKEESKKRVIATDNESEGQTSTASDPVPAGIAQPNSGVSDLVDGGSDVEELKRKCSKESETSQVEDMRDVEQEERGVRKLFSNLMRRRNSNPKGSKKDGKTAVLKKTPELPSAPIQELEPAHGQLSDSDDDKTLTTHGGGPIGKMKRFMKMGHDLMSNIWKLNMVILYILSIPGHIVHFIRSSVSRWHVVCIALVLICFWMYIDSKNSMQPDNSWYFEGLIRGIADLKAGQNNLKADLKAGQQELKVDLKSGQQELKADLKSGQQELKADLKAGQQELKNGQQGLNKKMDDHHNSLLKELIDRTWSVSGHVIERMKDIIKFW